MAQTILNNGLTISVLTVSETGGRIYADYGSAEIAFWSTTPTENSPHWVVPAEFNEYSGDGQVCSYVPLLMIYKYIARHSD